MSDSNPSTYAYVGEDDSGYFRTLHGKKLNALNSVYLLPVDEDAVKVPTKLLFLFLETYSSPRSPSLL